MTDSEKRRSQLLKETRMLYSDQGMAPAVHPRYQAVYKNLYGFDSQETEARNSNLGIRVLIAILLFVVFAMMDYRDITYANVGSEEIIQEIERTINLNAIKSIL